MLYAFKSITDKGIKIVSMAELQNFNIDPCGVRKDLAKLKRIYRDVSEDSDIGRVVLGTRR